jgi:hypothetical protein
MVEADIELAEVAAWAEGIEAVHARPPEADWPIW